MCWDQVLVQVLVGVLGCPSVGGSRCTNWDEHISTKCGGSRCVGMKVLVGSVRGSRCVGMKVLVGRCGGSRCVVMKVLVVWGVVGVLG